MTPHLLTSPVVHPQNNVMGVVPRRTHSHRIQIPIKDNQGAGGVKPKPPDSLRANSRVSNGSLKAETCTEWGRETSHEWLFP